MSDSEKKVSDLCVTCGMCCDGSLFDRALVRNEDDKKVAEALGLSTFSENGELFFRQPCPHFKSCCTTYDERRPQICSAYFCPPVKKFQREHQSFEETEEQVRGLLDHRNKLLQLATHFPDLAHLNFQELKSVLEDYAEDEGKVSEYRMLFLFFFIYRDTVKKYFTPEKQDRPAVK